jgi:hypothetical protein
MRSFDGQTMGCGPSAGVKENGRIEEGGVWKERKLSGWREARGIARMGEELLRGLV